MATITRFVDAPSGAGSQDGTSLANAYASIEGVRGEDPAGAGDDLIVELHGGIDDPASTMTWNVGGDTCVIKVMEGTYKLENSANFRTGINITRDTDFEGNFAFRCRSTATTSPSQGIRCQTNSPTVNFNKGAVVVDNAGSSIGFRVGGGITNVKNLIVENSGGDGAEVSFQVSSPTLNIDHGTITNNGGHGCNEVNNNSMNCRNVYSGGNTSNDFNSVSSQTTNASSDTTAVGTDFDSIAFNTTNFESVTSSDIDIGDTEALWGVPKAASGLQDAGTDISVAEDYRQASRDSSPDIGALESAAAPAPPAVGNFIPASHTQEYMRLIT